MIVKKCGPRPIVCVCVFRVSIFFERERGLHAGPGLSLSRFIPNTNTRKYKIIVVDKHIGLTQFGIA